MQTKVNECHDDSGTIACRNDDECRLLQWSEEEKLACTVIVEGLSVA